MSPLYPPTARPRPTPRPRFADRVSNFWLRVTEGLELNQLWSQFEKDARSSYRLYSTELDKKEAEPAPPGRKFLRTAERFFWAVLEKLTPAKRVLLLVALVLLFLPQSGMQFRTASGEVHVVEFDLHVWGGLLLLVLLVTEVADRVVMKRDLQIAKEIQNWLLPNEPPAIPGVEIAFVTRPANTVAGDYYDVFKRPEHEGQTDRYLLAVADVAGKSIPAAMIMATFQASLRTLSVTRRSLPDLIAGMNQYSCTNSQGGLRFTTAFLGEYDPAARTLTYVNAGHNAPMVCRKSGALERLEAGGLPIGILADTPYQSASVTLAPGDWIIIFTDGVVEAVNTQGEEFGEPRLLSVVNASASQSPGELLQAIMRHIDLFVGATPQHDDMTLLLIKAV
jgi:hypothetical protein